MAIFNCDQMAKNWAAVLAKRLGITDSAKISKAESYYKERCSAKTETNWKSKMETIFGV